MTRREERTSPVTLALQRRIPHGTGWLFHWAATDGDFLPPDGERRRLHAGERPIGVVVTGGYRDRILEESGIGRRWWNKSVESWVMAGITHRCSGYRGIFLFVFDDYACRRCGEIPKREPTVPVSGNSQFPKAGTLSSRSERETQAAIKAAQKVAKLEGLAVEGTDPEALQKSPRLRDWKTQAPPLRPREEASE